MKITRTSKPDSRHGGQQADERAVRPSRALPCPLYWSISLAALALAAPLAMGQCDGLVGEWTFDGGSLLDSSGHGNHAAGTGLTFVPGIVAEAFNTQILPTSGPQIPNAPSLNPTTAITLMAWYRPVPFGGSGSDPIIDKGYTSHNPPYYQYHLWVTGNSYWHARAMFGVSLAIAGVGHDAFTPENFWGYNTWYFIVATYDGSAIRLYVDGVLIVEQPASGPLSTYDTPVRIGSFDNFPNTYVPGTIDQVRIFDRALSPGEIQWWYANPQGYPLTMAAIASNGAPCAGSAITISLPSSAAGLTYQWRHNGVALADEPGHVSGANTATLSLANVQAADSGAYDCAWSGTQCAGTSGSVPVAVVDHCPADLDGGAGTGSCDGGVDINDLLYFLNAFEAGSSNADLADGSGNGTPDGGVDINDLLYFLAHFEAGC